MAAEDLDAKMLGVKVVAVLRVAGDLMAVMEQLTQEAVVEAPTVSEGVVGEKEALVS